MDLHLTLFLSSLPLYVSDILFGKLVLHTSPQGLLWVASCEPLRVPLQARTGDIILRLPEHIPDPFPLCVMLSSIRLCCILSHSPLHVFEMTSGQQVIRMFLRQ